MIIIQIMWEKAPTLTTFSMFYFEFGGSCGIFGFNKFFVPIFSEVISFQYLC